MELDEVKLRNGIDKVKNQTLRRFSNYIKGFTDGWSSDVHPVIVGNKILAMGSDWRVYFYVDRGTPRHNIPAKNNQYLVIPVGLFQPRTKPVAKKTGGSGKYIAVTGFTKHTSIEHPGGKARLITQTMVEEDNKEFLRDVNRAVMEAIKTND